MSCVLPGTAPSTTAQARADLTPAAAWIEARYDDFHRQWVAVRLENPVLVASAPALRQLWQTVLLTQLTDCLLQYVYTVKKGNPWVRGGQGERSRVHVRV